MPYKNPNYSKEYYQNNKEKHRASCALWEANNRDKRRAYALKSHKKHIESSVNAYLGKILCRIRNKAKTNQHIKYREYNLTVEYLVDLWQKQNQRCALTGKQMTYKFRNLFSVSIDRIDSDVGYIEGNVQLVCQAANYAKNNFTNEEFIYFWNNQEDKNEYSC